MDMLKKLFPFSFGANDVKGLILVVAAYIIVSAVIGWVLSLLAKIPLVGFIFGLVGGIIGLYCLIGIIVAVLKFFGMIK